MRRQIGIWDFAMVKTLGNLAMCRLTGGLWLIVMVLNTKILKIIAEVILNLVLIWVTRGYWLIVIAIMAVVRPVISDCMKRRQRNKRMKRRKRHRRS